MDDDPRGSDYRQAAEAALEQLDWCIGYIRRMRRKELARQLARNRAAIADLMPDDASRQPRWSWRAGSMT
jgi:hypothetical protein